MQDLLKQINAIVRMYLKWAPKVKAYSLQSACRMRASQTKTVV